MKEFVMYHYKPIDGYFGDPIPFFWKGTYHIFYLKVPLEPERKGSQFAAYEHLSTMDFIHWKEHPTAIKPGKAGPDAMGCWTGGVIERDGTFYLYYTGHNPDDEHWPQTICLATSKDLDDWEKSKENPILLPDPEISNIYHWRDPFVFWNEDENCYCMSITTLKKDEGMCKSGALMIARSDDLLEWEMGEVFYGSGNHGFPECSDIFKIGKYWYLVCSIFHKTCYRIGDTPLGPWRVGKTDSFDGVMNYAAKTISDGDKRFVIGWIRTREGQKDRGGWEWAGHMAFPREIVQDESDGTLYSKLPDQFEGIKEDCVFDLKNSSDCNINYGNWKTENSCIKTDGEIMYGEVELSAKLDAFDMTVEFEVESETKSAGMIFQLDKEKDYAGYEIAVDLRRQMLSFRRHTDRYETFTFQDIRVKENEELKLRVIVENGIVEAFLNDKFALACCFYTFSKSASTCLFIEEGSGVIKSCKVHELASQ